MAELTELVQVMVSPPVKNTLDGWAAEAERSIAWVVRKLIDAEITRRTKQLPMAIEETANESTDQMLRRLKVQGLPGFISNNISTEKLIEAVQDGGFHLGTGPGDEPK